jgi:hypothetical protein
MGGMEPAVQGITALKFQRKLFICKFFGNIRMREPGLDCRGLTKMGGTRELEQFLTVEVEARVQR